MAEFHRELSKKIPEHVHTKKKTVWSFDPEKPTTRSLNTKKPTVRIEMTVMPTVWTKSRGNPGFKNTNEDSTSR